MKIKRYMAPSMRAALDQVRAEQGPDAVILSSRRAEEGIEVIAAVDYDEALFAGANLRRAPSAPRLEPEPVAPAPAPTEADVRSQAAPVSPRNTKATVARAAVTPAPRMAAATVVPVMDVAAAVPNARPASVREQDDGVLAVRREVRDLRELLQGELAHMSWNDKRLREPLQARVLEELTALDIAPDIAMKLAAAAPRRTGADDPSQIPLAMLAKHLPVVGDLSALSGGVIALVGPTGAGKTTTIAKLAARWCMQHGSGELALVSTDGFRIGAREQLMTYAKILGAPMHAANSGKDLALLLGRLKSKKMVLIDTAGMGPRDIRLSEQLAALQLGAARARVLLTLPAQGEGHALEESVRSFARIRPAACIVTKVDESASLGAVISTALRHALPIAYLCTGQRVPEDLHAAHRRKVWLIKMAMKLKERAAPRVDEPYLARNFGRAPVHA